MLTDNDLSYMRDSIEMLFPDTCDILSVTRVVDASGGYTETWGTASANVPCRSDYINGVLQLAGGGLQPYRTLELSVPYDTTVTTDNRVKWNSGEYTIQNVNSNSWIACKFMEIKAVE